MFRVVEPRPVEPISLEDYLTRMDEIDCPPSESFTADFVERAGRLLQRLAANPSVVREYIDRCGGIEPSKRHFVPPQTFLIGGTRQFGLRVNLWPKLKPSNYRERERILYAYDVAHNHDFRLLTVGYHGPGYTTDVYEIDPQETFRPGGSSVNLFNHRFEQLTPGRVFSFDAYCDLHTQHPPQDMSISINLIPLVNPKTYEQGLFDPARSILIEPANSYVGRIATTIEVASAFPVEDTPALFAAVGEKVAKPRIDAAIAAGLSAISRTGPWTGEVPRHGS
jgi:hypothetical protein